MAQANIRLPTAHKKQIEFIYSDAKRKIIRAGRRGGKTEGCGIITVEKFLEGHRVLYAAPTSDQLSRWWTVVTRALEEPIKAGAFKKNETEHIIEKRGSDQRIRGKTAWNADTLRGDFCSVLILDEWQLMNEEAWELVGAPMLLDNNGDAIFIYTPPSLHTRSVSKANDPQHAAKMYRKFKAQMDAGNKRYYATTFSSFDNPFISGEALKEITSDMTSLAYRMEIMAEDIDEAPGALWTRDIIEKSRVIKPPEAYNEIVVGLDPSATSGGDEAGIVVAGRADDHYYILEDDSIQGSPEIWGKAAIRIFYKFKANKIIAESNQGGEMITLLLKQIDRNVPVDLVSASRGKQTRAEPISAIYEQGRAHHVGKFDALEDEMALWIPGDPSPNRMDAMVWAMTKLAGINEFHIY